MMPHIHPRHAIQQQPGNQEPTCSTTFVVVALHMYKECNRLKKKENLFSGKSHRIDSIFSPTGILLQSVCLPLPTLLFPSPANPEFPSVLHICVIPSLLFLSLFLDLYRRVQPDSNSLKTSTRADRKQRLLGLSYQNPTSNFFTVFTFFLLRTVLGFEENLWQ